MPTQTASTGHSIFEIAGPIMVGPSSSHTAGACKIGQIARAFFHKRPQKVVYNLHGSFAEVYKGHSTDRALVGGILKFKTGDPRIKRSFQIAAAKKMHFEFKIIDLGPQAHPNSVRIDMWHPEHEKMSVYGSSIGGGMAEIWQVDNFPLNLKISPGMKSLAVWHKKPTPTKNTQSTSHKTNFDPITRLTNKLKEHNIFVQNIQQANYKNAYLSIIDCDGPLLKISEVRALEKIPGIESIRSLISLKET